MQRPPPNATPQALTQLSAMSDSQQSKGRTAGPWPHGPPYSREGLGNEARQVSQADQQAMPITAGLCQLTTTNCECSCLTAVIAKLLSQASWSTLARRMSNSS